MEEVVEKPAAKGPSPRVIAFCVAAAAFGLLIAASAIANGWKQLEDDRREEILELDEPSAAEKDVERLTFETQALEAERARLRKECVEVEERLAALSQRAPKMVPLESFVALTKGGLVYLAVGKDDKVEIGYQFDITRAGHFVARVVASEVDARATACRVLVVKDGADVEVGDTATTLRP